MAPRRLPSLSDLLAAGVFAVAAYFGVHALREAGILERVDLAVHDRVVRSVTRTRPDERFVVVLENEADLAKWGYPLSDDTLAVLLETLLAAGPRAVAVDKYRDRPVAPGSQRLDTLLRKADRVIWVEKFSAATGEGVGAPPALDRRFVGCGDIIEDADGFVRRALLYLDRPGTVCYTMAFQLARIAAEARGAAMEFSREDPGLVTLGAAAVKAIDPGDGPYARADTAGFQVAIPTAAGLPGMQVVGMSDVLEGRVPASTLKDRVVLFGSSAESLRDFFTIPPVEGKVTGVQVHALIASHLLRVALGEAKPVRLVDGRSIYIAAGALAALAAVIACLRRRPWIVLSAGFAVFVTYVLVLNGLASRGTYIGAVAPALAFALVLAAGIARTGWIEYRERSNLMLIFSRHVSDEIAQEIWERREELMANGVFVPRNVEATVLFLDIRGFTSVMEKLPSERSVTWLNRGLSEMTEAIMRNRGVVTRFSGDAIMAVFGAPIPHAARPEIETDARNAILAALAIAPALDRLNAQSAAEVLPPIRVRIGINSGTMVQCSVGAARRMEFTLLGDAVNTAARLESFALDDDGATVRILIGERTMELAGARFETTAIGSLPLKGKDQAVAIHQVLLPR